MHENFLICSFLYNEVFSLNSKYYLFNLIEIALSLFSASYLMNWHFNKYYTNIYYSSSKNKNLINIYLLNTYNKFLIKKNLYKIIIHSYKLIINFFTVKLLNLKKFYSKDQEKDKATGSC